MSSHIWHPYTRHSEVESTFLPQMIRGEGAHLFDAQGNSYFDAISSWWCCNFGHSHPRLVEALRSQAAALQHSILGGLSHPAADVLSTRIAEAMPSSDRHVVFASDGSSAVEAALKIAIGYHAHRGQPERSLFVSLADPYHGDTLGAVSVGYMESFHSTVKPLVFDCLSTPVPHHAGDAAAFDAFDRLLSEHADRIAAVIVESICQGTAGMRFIPPSFLAHLQQRCQAYGVLLIVDEIAMGYGRTGTLFGFEQAGINPDIVTLGKGITGGTLPLSATVVRDFIYQVFADEPVNHSLYHGHTYAGNPIAAAVAIEVFSVIKEERVLERCQATSAQWPSLLAPLLSHPRVRNIRHLGMIAAWEIAPWPDYSPHRLRIAARDAGLLIRPLGETVYLTPPLITPVDVLADAVQRLAKLIPR